MAFSLEKFLSDMMGNTDNTKKTNKKNAKTRIVKKKVAPSQNMQDGGRAALKRSQRADRIAAAAKKEKAGIDKAYSRSAIASRAKKEKAGIDKAYNRSAALSTIKKDTNIKTDKGPKKKRIVTKEQLAKSGLSLRDYMNMLKSKETGRTISRDSRFDKKKPKSGPSSSKTMVDSFKKSNVSANKNKKAGIDSAKGDNKKSKNFSKVKDSKLDSKGNYKGTNIKPTKLQAERMKKRRAKGATT